jgi:two-component system LytT family response regulator
MSDVRVLIVDDEPVVRSGIQRLLQAEPDVTVVGEARHGREALGMITTHAPDVVFLDVQMPEMDGLDVVRALGGTRLPAIVFVTAYDRYAVQAFELHAIDYLLKPFDAERFRAALQRVRHHLAARDSDALAARMTELLAMLRPESGRLTRFLVRVGRKVVLVNADEVEWIEAADNYVQLHTAAGHHLLRETMKNLEKRLDPDAFVRIHRSAMVNLARIAELRPLPSGDYSVRLRSGATVSLSRRYREAFERRVGRAL